VDVEFEEVVHLVRNRGDGAVETCILAFEEAQLQRRLRLVAYGERNVLEFSGLVENVLTRISSVPTAVPPRERGRENQHDVGREKLGRRVGVEELTSSG